MSLHLCTAAGKGGAQSESDRGLHCKSDHSGSSSQCLLQENNCHLANIWIIVILQMQIIAILQMQIIVILQMQPYLLTRQCPAEVTREAAPMSSFDRWWLAMPSSPMHGYWLPEIIQRSNHPKMIVSEGREWGQAKGLHVAGYLNVSCSWTNPLLGRLARLPLTMEHQTIKCWSSGRLQKQNDFHRQWILW